MGALRDGREQIFKNSTTLLDTGVRSSRPFTQLSNDGRLVALGGTNGVVQVWDLQRRILLREIKASTGIIWPIAFLARGRSLVIRHAHDGSLHEWNLTSGTKAQSWSAPWNEWNYGCTFSQDERQCLMLGYGGDSRLRDMKTGREMTLPLGLRETEDADFSPDGKLIAAASELGMVKLWETGTFQTVATLSGFMLGVSSTGFSPDGTRLATGSSGKEAIKIWDLESFQQLLTLEGQGSGFELTEFSPDGSVLGSMSGTGVLHLWRAPSWATLEADEQAQPKPSRGTMP